MHEIVEYRRYNALDESVGTADTPDMTVDAAPTMPRSLLALLRSWRPSTRSATLTIVGTAVAYAFAAFFARRLTEAGLAPATVAFARFALIAVVLGRFVRLDRAAWPATRWGLLSGAAMSVGWIAYVHAVGHGSVATAGLIYMTYPLFTLMALAVVFGRPPTAGQMLGGLLVVLGGAVALGAGSGAPLIAFLAPATFGFAIAVLTERLQVLDPTERLASVAVGATVVLLPVLMSLSPSEAIPADLGSWSMVLGLAVGSALVPMLLYAAAAPAIGAARTAVAGSAELPTVFVIGAVFFGEAVGIHHLVGAAIIVAAIVITPATRTLHVRPDDDFGESDRPDDERPDTAGPHDRTRSPY